MKQDAAAWKTRTEGFVSADERKEFYARSPWRSVYTFLHIWAALAASLWFIWILTQGSLALHIAIAPLIACFIATRINAFAVQIHEASHGLLFPSKRLNDRFCNFAGAYWILNDVRTYWSVHRDHHAFLHDHNDPDLHLYLLPRAEGGAVLLLLLQDLLGVTAIRRVISYATREKSPLTANSNLGHTAGKITTLGLVLACFLAIFGPITGSLLYLTYWIVPLFCIFPLIIRIRIVAEHYSDALHQDIPRLFVSRTSVSGAFEEYLIGAQMQYHMEHHLFPKIPYHQLKRFHRLLRKQGFFDELGKEQEHALSGGYLHYWKELLKGSRTTQATGAKIA